MTTDEAMPGDERFADLIAAYDEALAKGEPLRTARTADLEPDLQRRLERGIACLHLLRTLLPGADPAAKGMPAALGRFQIRRELGRGSFGRVFLAFDPRLGREVALKVPRPEALGSHDLRERFRREARAAAGLDHPHVVPVYEAGEEAGVCYMASAYCPGPTLAAWLKQRTEPVPARLAAALVAALAEAVEHAHGRGVLHRDLKPSNVILSPRSLNGPEPATGDELAFVPRVTDFGLAKLLSPPGGAGSTGGYETQSGAILGTPNYMAPEQAAGQGKAVGPAADVYALGAILYELLTGRPPFQGELLDTLEQVRSQEPVPPARLRPQLPPDLQTVCLKCLRKEPGKRYASAEALAEDLRRFLRGEPVRARPVSAWEQAVKWVRRRPAVAALLGVSGLAALALVGVGVGVWYNGRLRDALGERETQRAAAEEQRTRFEQLQRQIRYVRDIDLAWRAWQTANIPRVLEVLDGPGCPADLRGWEWGYLRGLCTKSLRNLAAGREVSALACSPDGRWLATTDRTRGLGNLVEVWETATGRKRWTLRGHHGRVNRVAFSPDGRWLASASDDHTVQVWDTARGERISILTRNQAERVHTVAFSPDGRLLASGGGDKVVILWNTATWNMHRTLDGHLDAIRNVAFSPDGRRLVSTDWRIHLWDTTTWELVYTIRWGYHGAPISSVAFSPDGMILATGSDNDTVKLWDAAKGTERATLRGNTGWLVQRATPHHEPLATAGFGGTVRLWEVATGKEVGVLPGHTETHTNSVVFSPDGRLLASGSLDGTVRLWGPADGSQAVRSLPGHPGSICQAIAFAPAGALLVTGGRDNTVRLWEPARGAERHTLRGHKGWVMGVAVSPDGRSVASASLDGTVKLWDATRGQEVQTFTAGAKSVEQPAFSPDGRLLAAGGWDGTAKVWVWNVAGGPPVHTFAEPARRSPCVAFSPDGRRLAFSGPGETIKLIDLTTGQEVASLGGHPGGIESLAFSPDGRLLGSAGQDYTAKLWDLTAGREVLTFHGHMDRVSGVAFSPDGRRLATCSNDQTVRLWDTASGQEVLTLHRPDSVFHGVAFSDDGRWLAACGAGSESRLYLWEADPDPR